MKVKILLCGCHNMKLKPEQIDMNTLPAALDGDIDTRLNRSRFNLYCSYILQNQH